MTDDIEAIRERKRRELQQRLEDDASDDGDATPADPVYVEGADHLDDLVGQYDVVLADFYADRCGPCQMLEPVIGQVAAETDAAVAKVDVDTHQSLAAQYGVRGVPTLVLFADGDVAEQVSGVRQKEQLVSLVEQYT